MRIFIHRGQSTFGPYRMEDVVHELGNGSLKPTDMATYDGGGTRFVPLSAVPGVLEAAAKPSADKLLRARVGWWGWLVVAVVLVFVGSLFLDTTATHSDTAEYKSGPAQRAMSPREFGRKLGRELLRHARTDSGTQGMYYFAQSCRTENPTVKTYSEAEFGQFHTGLVEAYTEWRTSGYHVPGESVLDR